MTNAAFGFRNGAAIRNCYTRYELYSAIGYSSALKGSSKAGSVGLLPELEYNIVLMAVSYHIIELSSEASNTENPERLKITKMITLKSEA